MWRKSYFLPFCLTIECSLKRHSLNEAVLWPALVQVHTRRWQWLPFLVSQWAVSCGVRKSKCFTQGGTSFSISVLKACSCLCTAHLDKMSTATSQIKYGRASMNKCIHRYSTYLNIPWKRTKNGLTCAAMLCSYYETMSAAHRRPPRGHTEADLRQAALRSSAQPLSPSHLNDKTYGFPSLKHKGKMLSQRANQSMLVDLAGAQLCTSCCSAKQGTVRFWSSCAQPWQDWKAYAVCRMPYSIFHHEIPSHILWHPFKPEMLFHHITLCLFDKDCLRHGLPMRCAAACATLLHTAPHRNNDPWELKEWNVNEFLQSYPVFNQLHAFVEMRIGWDGSSLEVPAACVPGRFVRQVPHVSQLIYVFPKNLESGNQTLSKSSQPSHFEIRCRPLSLWPEP